MRVIDSRSEARCYSRLPCSILDVAAQKYIRVGLGGSSYKLIKPKSASKMYIRHTCILDTLSVYYVVFSVKRRTIGF